MKPVFIVIEGPDGLGKTTLAHHAVDWFNRHQHDALYVKNPGATIAGQKIRQLCKDDDYKLEPDALALLMAADWYETVHKIVKPAMANGLSIVADRYNYVSGKCYNDPGIIDGLYSSILAVSPVCDLLMILTAPQEEAWNRLKNRCDVDRFDRAVDDPEAYETLCRRYRAVASQARHHPLFRCVQAIDASGDLESVKFAIEQQLETMMAVAGA